MKVFGFACGGWGIVSWFTVVLLLSDIQNNLQHTVDRGNGLFAGEHFLRLKLLSGAVHDAAQDDIPPIGREELTELPAAAAVKASRQIEATTAKKRLQERHIFQFPRFRK